MSVAFSLDTRQIKKLEESVNKKHVPAEVHLSIFCARRIVLTAFRMLMIHIDTLLATPDKRAEHMNTHDDLDLLTKWLRTIRRKKLVAGVIFACVTIVGLATVTDALSKLMNVYRALSGGSETPQASSPDSFRQLQMGHTNEIRWLAERLLTKGAVEGFVWGDYQITVTMGIDKPSPNKFVLSGTMSNIKGPEFSTPDTYSIIYDALLGEIVTTLALDSAAFPELSMPGMRRSEAVHYQEQWNEVRLLILMTIDETLRSSQGRLYSSWTEPADINSPEASSGNAVIPGTRTSRSRRR